MRRQVTAVMRDDDPNREKNEQHGQESHSQTGGAYTVDLSGTSEHAPSLDPN